MEIGRKLIIMVEPRPEQVMRYMQWEEFDLAIQKIVKQIKGFEKTNKRFEAVYGIPRGGLVVAVCMSHQLEIPLIVAKPTDKDNILICDDISDSGSTLERFKDFKIATIFWKPNSKVKPDFYYKGMNEKLWVVFPWEKGD